MGTGEGMRIQGGYITGPDFVLRPVAAAEGERAYVLLPSLDRLLGTQGFGEPRPIMTAEARRPQNGWSLFGPARARHVSFQ